MQAQSLSAAKIDQLDDAVGHEHDISTLNVPERKSSYLKADGMNEEHFCNEGW